MAVLFEVPPATVEARNASRDRAAPVHIVRAHHQLLPDPAQLRAEGFAAEHP
ncbi:hypothetical protein [Streptomyces sp. 147326]|uniref:hypothetical protein n=1 Tax=Streptomyces sp. 147326 TaxID=3074379 RepID=UPI003857AF21